MEGSSDKAPAAHLTCAMHPETPNKRASITARFDEAKKEQAVKEAERREAIRRSTKLVTPRKESSEGDGEGGDGEEAVAPSPMNKRWEAAVNKGKQAHQEIVSAKKLNTISGFRMTEGTGIVKQHINKWEELFMTVKASASQVKATVEAARAKARSASLNRNKKNVAIIVDSESVAEDYEMNKDAELFISGSTFIYDAKIIGSKAIRLIEKEMENNSGKPLDLACGVYGAHGHDETLELDLVAIGMRDDEDNTLIALTITVKDGFESEKEVYGTKKVAIFMSSSKSPLFERLVDLAPASTSTVESITAPVATSRAPFYDTQSSTESSLVPSATATVESVATDYAVEDELTSGMTTRPTEEDITEATIEHISIEIPSVDETAEILPSASLDSTTSSSSPDLREVSSQPDTNDVFITHDDINDVIPDFKADYNSDDDADDIFMDENRFVDEPASSTVGSVDGSPSSTTFGLPITLPSVKSDSKCFHSSHQMFRNNVWRLEDESLDQLKEANHVLMKLNISDIISITSTSNGLILQSAETSSIITGTLKYVSSPSQCMVVKDTVYEWTRGAAASGWLTKWPMQSQTSGRMTKRFFILRDRLISYYKRRPLTSEAADAAFAVGILLTPNSSVSKGRHFLIPCITIATATDTLWVRCGNNAAEQDVWIKEIRTAISHLNKSQLFYSKARVESVWHHESKHFNCISVDAVNSIAAVRRDSGRHAISHAALFVLESGTAGSSSGKTSPSKVPSRNSDETLSQTAKYAYSVDISFNGRERHQYELNSHSLHSSIRTDIGSRLCCIKACGDMLLLGGSVGYIGLAIIEPEGLSSAILGVRRASYIEGLEFMEEDIFREVNGHKSTSAVTCLATKVLSNDAIMFAGGDNEGGVSLWRIESEVLSTSNDTKQTVTKAKLLSFVSAFDLGGGVASRSEQVRALRFVADSQDQSNKLIISTNERLLCIDIVGNKFFSYVELDHVMPGIEAIYSLSIENDNTDDKAGRSVTLWKVVGSEHVGSSGKKPTSPSTKPDCIVYRVNWTDYWYSGDAFVHMKPIGEDCLRSHLSN